MSDELKKKKNKKRHRRHQSKLRRLVWHYTVGIHIEKIFLAGMLLTERETTGWALPPGYVGAVWFSSNEVWEPTARKGGAWTMQDNHELYGGLFRFGVELTDDLLPWKKFRPVSGISAEATRELARTGREMGANPNQWCASMKPIPQERWVAVEMWDDKQWVRVWPEQVNAAGPATERRAPCVGA